MRREDVSKLAQLAEPLRSRLTALLQAAGGKVWITSGRRSVEEQVQLRRQHCGPTTYDIWSRPASQCSPPTAPPGRSKHNTGLAADLGGDLATAARLGAKFGLDTPVGGEPWHFEVAGGATGFKLPGPDDLICATVPAACPAVDAAGNAIESAVSSALGAVVDPLLGGLRRIALVGLFLTGGVALVVMGGIRGTQPLRDQLKTPKELLAEEASNAI